MEVVVVAVDLVVFGLGVVGARAKMMVYVIANEVFFGRKYKHFFS